MGIFRPTRSSKNRSAVARRRLLFEPLETRNLMALDLAAIGGTAFVDLTGDGLTADDTRIAGATVELYRDDGDGTFDSATDTLLGTTTTDASGAYRFASTNAGGLLAAGTLSADDYFVRQLPLASFSPPAAALVTIATANVEGTTVQTVDTFDTTAQSVTADPLSPSDSSVVAASEAIGGERDVLVTHTSGAGQVSLQIDQFDSNLLAFVSGLDVIGTALVQYDGIDGDATALNATGLGAIDLSGSDANAGLLLATRGDAPGATAELRVYTNATDFSTTTINIPAQALTENMFVPFSAFVVGGGAGATFTSIGAIELLINGVADLDATVTVLSSLRPSEVTSNLENQTPSIEIVKLTNGVDANTAESGPLLQVGATVTFTYTVSSTGGTSLENVVVTDDNGTAGDATDDFSPVFVEGDTNGNNILEPTETWTYSATGTVTAGQYTNIGSVTAEDAVGTQVTDSDPSNHFGVSAAVNLVKSTNGEDANAASGPVLPVGSTATFTYVVTNPGNVPLDSVAVRDDNGTAGDTSDDFDATFLGGDTNSDGRLDTTETWTYQATHTVTAGQYTNTATVTGNPVDALGADIAGIADPQDSDPSNHFGATAGINVVKSTNGQDANTAPGPILAVGSTATFTYVVTNTGNVPLANVVVSDDNGTAGDPADDFTATLQSGDTNTDGLLDPTETWTFQATRTVTAGQHTNLGTATANPVDFAGADIAGMADASDSDTSNHLGAVAGINLVKSTNGQDANTAPGPILAVGSTATFTYVVTNTGNVPLANVVVSDDNGTAGDPADDFTATLQSGDTNSDGLLDPTEIWTFQATRTVTAGQHTNIGTATANPVDFAGDDIEGLADVSDSDASNHLGAAAGINIVKSTNGQDANTTTGPLLLVGSTATFTYVVTNTGTTSLATVVVRDDNGTPADTTDDFTPTLLSGDTNANGRLDTTETWTYQATRTVTAGQHTNIGSVTANAVDDAGADIPGFADVSDSDPSNHLGIVTGINIVKSTNGQDANTGTGPVVAVGSTATFTYVVTNTGTVPLATVVVRDDNGTAGSTADDFSPTLQSGDTNADGRLDTTETWTYQATRTVTAGQYTNNGSVTANPVDSTGTDIPNVADVSDSDASNHFGFLAGIALQKLTNGIDTVAGPGPNLGIGSIATFTYNVTNTGNIALTNIVITDNNGTAGNTADDLTPTRISGDTDGDNQLDVNETWVYQATRIVTLGAYSNSATVSGEDPADTLVSATDLSSHVGIERLSKRRFIASGN